MERQQWCMLRQSCACAYPARLACTVHARRWCEHCTAPNSNAVVVCWPCDAFAYATFKVPVAPGRWADLAKCSRVVRVDNTVYVAGARAAASMPIACDLRAAAAAAAAAALKSSPPRYTHTGCRQRTSHVHCISHLANSEGTPACPMRLPWPYTPLFRSHRGVLTSLSLSLSHPRPSSPCWPMRIFSTSTRTKAQPHPATPQRSKCTPSLPSLNPL